MTTTEPTIKDLQAANTDLQVRCNLLTEQRNQLSAQYHELAIETAILRHKVAILSEAGTTPAASQ